jgi:NAD+ synthetase
MERVHRGLTLGLRDYLHKCGFRNVVIGLSGGIDSAVVAALAVDALGAGHVRGVYMPSRFSSEGSRTDAEALAGNLGIGFETISIEPMFQTVIEELSPHFGVRPWDVAEENIQSRLRGLTLMALSNKFGCLVLSTGNKSEVAVGYATLYGDMCGGLAPIADVPKTMIYELARYLNALRAPAPLIPESTLTKPPSAELRPEQKDTDSLPPYDILDPIIHAYVEQSLSPDAIIGLGHDAETVRRVVRMIDAAEYKRRQAAPTLKITSRAFGYGWRMPLARGRET